MSASAVKSVHQFLGYRPGRLDIGRAPGRGFLLRGFTALILHLAAIETHIDARLRRAIGEDIRVFGRRLSA
jgi:hypothetical protein